MRRKNYTSTFIIDIIFFISGLVLLFGFLFILIPQIQGIMSWIIVILPIFLSIFLLGALEIIFGFNIIFTKKIKLKTQRSIGGSSLIIGCLYAYLWWYVPFMWFLILDLFIFGLLMLFLVMKNGTAYLDNKLNAMIKQCPNCGMMDETNNKFCTKCGAKLQ
jgi:hypothetical protein